MRYSVVAPVLALSLLLAACGGSSSGSSSSAGSGSVSTAERKAGFAAPGLVMVRDASNADAASCQLGKQLAGGRHYRVQLTSASNETISFEVIEPKVINCKSGNPLVEALALSYGGSTWMGSFVNLVGLAGLIARGL
mgnify:CR=1 FL=1